MGVAIGLRYCGGSAITPDDYRGRGSKPPRPNPPPQGERGAKREPGGRSCTCLALFGKDEATEDVYSPRISARRRHSAILAVEIGQRHRMDLLGAAQMAAVVAPGIGEAGVLDEMNIEAEVAGHANRGFHRVVGDDPRRRRDRRCRGSRSRVSRSVPMKALLVCLAITVSPGSGIASGLKSLPGWPGAIGGIRLTGIMADVNDRPAGLAPLAKQTRDVAFRSGIVARSLGRPARVVDRLLQVDEDQGSVDGQSSRAPAIECRPRG